MTTSTFHFAAKTNTAHEFATKSSTTETPRRKLARFKARDEK